MAGEIAVTASRIRELRDWWWLVALLGFAAVAGYKVLHDLAAIKSDRYTLTMASEDALREALANPGHRVPDPRNPGQYVVVQQAQIVGGGSGRSTRTTD